VHLMINRDGAKITFVVMVHIFQIGQFKISQRTNFWPLSRKKCNTELVLMVVEFVLKNKPISCATFHGKNPIK
jgi:hypothetical protein